MVDLVRDWVELHASDPNFLQCAVTIVLFAHHTIVCQLITNYPVKVVPVFNWQDIDSRS